MSGILKSSVHIVLQDNTKNTIKAISDAGLPSLLCSNHTLQLAVNKGFLYYMLQSLNEQKQALGIFGSEQLLGHLNVHQWTLLEKVPLSWLR